MAHLFQVAEGFQYDEVHAAFEERLYLLPEEGAGFSGGDKANRLNRLAEWANRACNEDGLAANLAHLAGELGPTGVYPGNLVVEVVLAELEAVRAVGVGLDDLCARPDVCLMHLAHEVGRGDVALVKAGIRGHAHGIEHRAHCPIANDGSRLP